MIYTNAEIRDLISKGIKKDHLIDIARFKGLTVKTYNRKFRIINDLQDLMDKEDKDSIKIEGYLNEIKHLKDKNYNVNDIVMYTLEQKPKEKRVGIVTSVVTWSENGKINTTYILSDPNTHESIKKDFTIIGLAESFKGIGDRYNDS